MVVAEAIKEYIAVRYGTDNCITTEGCDALGLDCMTGAALRTPLPTGYTRDDICIAEVYDWMYANVGWCIGVAMFNISFNSTPTGAAIWVDGANSGSVTPATLSLASGTRNIVLKKPPEYQDYSQSISVTADTSYTWILTPSVIGKATLWLGTDPPGAYAYLDCEPEEAGCTPLTTDTKNAAAGLYDKFDVNAPMRHKITITLSGYEEFVADSIDDPNLKDTDGVMPEGYNWYVMPTLTPLAGTDVARLTVYAYKDEEKPANVPIENAALKKGTMMMGFIPYNPPPYDASKFWRAAPTGTKYNISVVAQGRETYLKTITLFKDQAQDIEAYLPVEVVTHEIKIVPGIAFVDDIGTEDIWYIGTSVDGWVRIETFITTPTMFKCLLTICNPGTTTPAWSTKTDTDSRKPYHIRTESKVLHPAMTALERHLDWAPWPVPDKPGEYSLVAEVVYEV